MNIGFILHLYQPSTQTENVFKQICSESYIPLLKLIKNNPAYKFTLNVPLSLLELMDKYGHSDWIKDLKDLCDSERVEVTGSAAYHALLTKTSDNFIEQQIILNEYGLGYFLGSRQGFEGEESILVKNLRGFFPPELSVDENVINKVSDLGYEWLLADKCVVPQADTLMLGQNVFKYKDASALLVIRDCHISNEFSFKRDSAGDDIIELIKKRAETAETLVIALDAEAFGHHNKEGIYLLDYVIDNLIDSGHELSLISEIVELTPNEKTDQIFESNWSEITCTNDPTKLYKLWDNKENEIQKSLWYIQENIVKAYEKAFGLSYQTLLQNLPEGFENIAVWNSTQLAKMPPTEKGIIELMVLVNKSLQSDQFWWASKETLYDKVLFSPTMITRVLDYYKEISARLDDKDLIYLVSHKSEEIENLLKEKSE